MRNHPVTHVGIDIGGTSIKAAAVVDGKEFWTRQSGFYRKPALSHLRRALREVCPAPVEGPVRVGLCLPGLLDRAARRVTLAVNAPGLAETDLDAMLADVIGPGYTPATIVNDGVACATDATTRLGLKGRSLVLAMGTGVGAAVLDDGVALVVEGASPGHVGQFDVSLADDPVIGPDGGAGGLEGYVGAQQLVERYGPDLGSAFARFTGSEPCLMALARAVRLCHAMYRPHHVVLCGGVGIRLKPALPHLDKLIRRQLTSIARDGWTLSCGVDDFHAARGAATLAKT